MQEYFPLVLFIVLAIGNVVAILVLSAIMGPKRNSKNKKTVYECGVEPLKNARQRFNVNFYLTAVSFLVFDIEMVLLLPWASTYSAHAAAYGGLGAFRLGMIGIFMVLLVVGLVFEFRRKGLEWD